MPQITHCGMFYDKTMMRHIEMHQIENAEDLRQANAVGLDIAEDEVCENCYEAVGESTDAKKFAPFLLVLDDEAEWVVCVECATPVL